MELSFLPLFLTIVGFVIGLGAVTVIDIHGFLGRKSSYWTIATTRTHKVTKPLIWIGIILATTGTLLVYKGTDPFSTLQKLFSGALILNGLFLSLKVSPFLLEREKEGRDGAILPDSFQRKITWSFIFSDILWWGSVVMFVIFLSR